MKAKKIMQKISAKVDENYNEWKKEGNCGNENFASSMLTSIKWNDGSEENELKHFSESFFIV